MANSILVEAQKSRRTQLSEVEAKALLKEAGIDTVETKLAVSQSQALAIAQEMGLPVALKISSPDIIHKSDTGGVKLGLNSKKAVATAYRDIMAAVKQKEPKAHIDGVTVQKMARPGIEVIMGMAKDPQFGPFLMFGLGGVWVEVLKDVSFRIVPITRRDAREMIKEIKGYPLLEGYRGSEPANVPLLEDMLLKLSYFVEHNPEIKELDINPIFAYKNGAVAVDARIILEPPA
ncbi:MAG: acetyl-CoA synthetase [Dehalococcoidia bacterium]|nr:acetyl-CoA synthetase [Dehalococcoidia bacterium]MBF8304557.1 acetyl-CoA synthetase [Dehalococcoidia bacterium]